MVMVGLVVVGVAGAPPRRCHFVERRGNMRKRVFWTENKIGETFEEEKKNKQFRFFQQIQEQGRLQQFFCSLENVFISSPAAEEKLAVVCHRRGCSIRKKKKRKTHLPID